MHLNLQQVAESFGVSETVVEDWVRQEGMPHVVDRDRLLFRHDEVAAWAETRGLAARAGFLAPGTSALEAGFDLDALLRRGGIWRDVDPADVRATLARMAGELPGLTAAVGQLLAQRIRSPDGLVWAPVGHGFALPHLSARVALGRDSGVVAALLLRGALPLEKPPADGVPVTRLLFFIAPAPRAHLDLLARLGRLVLDPAFREALGSAAADERILAAASALPASGHPGAR